MSDRLALIIATGEYDDPNLTELETPSHDAEALAEVLRDPAIGGFEVTPLVNETQRIVLEAIAHLYQRRKRGDLLLLYYSGHGIKDDHGDLYLAVKDTETDIVSATAIDAAFVRNRIDKSGSQRKVVVLDCCHSGAFADGFKAALGSSVGMKDVLAGSGYGRVILTASNAFEYAWEGGELLGEAETSVFTHFLVKGLRTGAADLHEDGKIDLDELYDYAHGKVLDSGSKQTPQKSVHKVEGRIIIAQNPHPPK
ncbi:MAG: caspase domain-containing protein, partial [Promethearchaeota archaeon]